MVKRKNGTNSSFMCSQVDSLTAQNAAMSGLASGPLVHEMQQRTDRAGEREADQLPTQQPFLHKDTSVYLLCPLYGFRRHFIPRDTKTARPSLTRWAKTAILIMVICRAAVPDKEWEASAELADDFGMDEQMSPLAGRQNIEFTNRQLVSLIFADAGRAAARHHGGSCGLADGRDRGRCVDLGGVARGQASAR